MRMFRSIFKKKILHTFKFHYKIGDKVLFRYSVREAYKNGKIIEIDDISEYKNYEISSIDLMVYTVKGEDGKIYHVADGFHHNQVCYIIKKI